MGIRCCTIRDVAPGLRPFAGVRAMLENPDNHPLGLAAFNHPGPEQAALVTGSRWATGKTIRVKFLGGDKAGRDEVVAALGEWSLYANVTFVVANTGDAEVRVAFEDGAGSWSYVGTDCLAVPANQPTMNIGWPDDIARSLHEVGHALGLIHEHQNPLAKIPWNLPAVLAFYSQPPNSWTYPEIFQQVIAPESRPLTNGGYDRGSIMEYPIDASWVTDPSYAVGWNQRLSDKDKAFIAQMYPGRWSPSGPVPPPTQPGEPGTPSGPIGAEGGTRFKFHVPAAGDYELTLSPAKRGG